MRILRILTLAAAASGCSIDDITGAEQLSALREQRDKWVALGIANYSFDYQRLCYCGTPAIQPVRIVVQNGAVVQVTNTLRGESVPLVGPVWPTIDALYAEYEQRMNDGYQVSIVYDGQRHFPGKALGDYPMAIDDEFEDTISQFVVNAGPASH